MSNDLVPAVTPVALIPYPTSEAVLEAFLNTLDSPRTKRAYRREVERALEDLGDLQSITPVALTQHREYWVARMDEKQAKPLSPAAVLRHLAALRSFLKFARWTFQIQLTTEVIAFALKSPQAKVIRPYQILTHEERNQMIGAARGNLRDRVLLEFIVNTGLRAAEVCNLRVRDLNRDENRSLIVHVRQGKGRKDRLVPLNEDTAMIVPLYLKERKIKLGNAKDADEYLFASRKGKGHGRLDPGHLWKLVVHYAKAAGIEKAISPHSLRHTAAITWLRSGASVPDVQELLGHESMATTQKYLKHIDMDKLKQIVNTPLPKKRSPTAF